MKIDHVGLLLFLRDAGHLKDCLISKNGLAKECSCGLWRLAEQLVKYREHLNKK